MSRLRLPLPRLDRARLRRYLRRSLLLLPLLAIIAALVTWKPWRQLGELLPEPVQSPAVQSDPGQDPAVLRLLDAAGVALSQGRLIEPPGRNAFELYRAVLARHPGDPIATRGIERIADQFVIEAEHALADLDLPGLAGTLDALRSVQPDHPRLADFTARLARERNRRTAAPRTPTVTDVTAGRTLDITAARSDAGRVQSFVQLASERMASGHLVGGADSAHAYLFAGRRLDPADPGIRQGIQLLGALLENNARRELAAGRLDAASTWAHDAIALNHDRAALARLRSDLQAARFATLREYQPLLPAGGPAGATPAAISTVVLQPVVTPREPTAAPPPTVVPESQLQRRRFRSPDYPERAVVQRLEGWIDIEFTVARDGTTREPRILAAEPAGVFDRATLDALARWRYEPVNIAGVPADQRVAMRLRFELAD